MSSWNEYPKRLRRFLEQGSDRVGFFFFPRAAIDLGTANTRLYLQGKGILLREPSLAAVDTAAGEPLCFGSEARAMLGRTPDSILAVRPLRQGVIADHDLTAAMLCHFLRRVCGRHFLRRPQVLLCVPGKVTEVEQRALRSAALQAGARQADIVPEVLAAALGAGLPIDRPAGCMVVDIGGGTTSAAVISLGGVAVCRSARLGGDSFDAAILSHLRQQHNLLIGERTAEAVKLRLGALCPADTPPMEVKGRSLTDGLPRTVTLTGEEVRTALAEPAARLIEVVRAALEATPPELAADLLDRGILLTGGGALLPGLEQQLAASIGISVQTAKLPTDCAALGMGKLLEQPALLRRLTADCRKEG